MLVESRNLQGKDAIRLIRFDSKILFSLILSKNVPSAFYIFPGRD